MSKKDSVTGVFYEYCEIFKNSFFKEHLRWLLLDQNNHLTTVLKVLKLEASSLISQRHLTKCDIIFMNSKLLHDFLNEINSTSSSWWAIFNLEKCQYWSTSRIYSWSFIVFWFTLMRAFHLTQSYLPMMSLFCYTWHSNFCI